MEAYGNYSGKPPFPKTFYLIFTHIGRIKITKIEWGDVGIAPY